MQSAKHRLNFIVNPDNTELVLSSDSKASNANSITNPIDVERDLRPANVQTATISSAAAENVNGQPDYLYDFIALVGVLRNLPDIGDLFSINGINDIVNTWYLDNITRSNSVKNFGERITKFCDYISDQFLSECVADQEKINEIKIKRNALLMGSANIKIIHVSPQACALYKNIMSIKRKSTSKVRDEQDGNVSKGKKRKTKSPPQKKPTHTNKNISNTVLIMTTDNLLIADLADTEDKNNLNKHTANLDTENNPVYRSLNKRKASEKTLLAFVDMVEAFKLATFFSYGEISEKMNSDPTWLSKIISAWRPTPGADGPQRKKIRSFCTHLLDFLSMAISDEVYIQISSKQLPPIVESMKKFIENIYLDFITAAEKKYIFSTLEPVASKFAFSLDFLIHSTMVLPDHSFTASTSTTTSTTSTSSSSVSSAPVNFVQSLQSPQSSPSSAYSSTHTLFEGQSGAVGQREVNQSDGVKQRIRDNILTKISQQVEENKFP